MTIHDDIAAVDAAIKTEIDAVLASIKDDLGRLQTLLTSLSTSDAARKTEADRVNPVVSALQTLSIP
jgi:enoyl-[acyl-carrier-protein] reductase (NADH)